MKQFLTSSLIAISLGTSSVALAQDAKADAAMRDSVKLMEKNNWQQALDKLQPLIDKHGAAGVKKFGAKFGVAYYYRGLCQLKLAQKARKEGKKDVASALYLKAITALKQCHSIKNTEKDIKERTANNYGVKALMLQGNAEQAVDQFGAAIKSYKTFLLERNSIRDTFDASDFNINLAICFWKIGKQDNGENDAKAEELFLRAVKAKFRPASTKSMLTGLRAMIESYSERGKKVDLEAFMATHRDAFLVPLIELHDALPYLSALTLEAANLGLLETVKTLANAIPSELVTKLESHTLKELRDLAELHEYEVPEIDGLPLDGSTLDQWDSVREKALIALQEAEQLAICARAISLEKVGYYRGSLAAYEFLLEDPVFAASVHRADYLYNASRLALLSSDAEKAYKYGLKFLTSNAGHDLAGDLQHILMVTFYFSGNYDLCASIGEKTPQIINVDRPPETNFFSFTLGGSYYYTGQFTKAETYLEDLTKMDAVYQETASYLYASTLGKLQKWKQSIDLLDSYIAGNPKDKVYIPFAYYDKAFALYSMQKYEEAQITLAQFQGKFKDSIIKPQAHILLGNIYSLERKRTQAETEYLAAISSAKDVANNHAKEEAYYLLISLLGQRTWDGLANERLLDTIPFLEKFLKEGGARKSPYYTQVITASYDALKRAKRENEAYDLLEQAIYLHNQKPNTPGTETALKTYNIAKRKAKFSDEDIIAGLMKSKHLANTPYHAGLLKVAELDVLERSQRLSPKPERAKKIKDIYLNLHVEHDIEALDNFALIKVADYLKDNGGMDSKTMVATYYKAVLNSRSKIKRPQALVGLATALAQSDNPKDRELALERFHAIIDDPFTRAKPKADAHYQLIEILYGQSKFPELTRQIKAYLKYPTKAKLDIRRVEMLLALSYDKQGFTDQAIGAYNSVWVNSFENLDQSAPAIDRITDLIWQRNTPAKEGLQDGKSDKQVAYETAYKYIRRTKKHYNKIRSNMTREGIEAWERINDKINTFQSDKDVKRFK